MQKLPGRLTFRCINCRDSQNVEGGGDPLFENGKYIYLRFVRRAEKWLQLEKAPLNEYSKSD